MTWRPTILRPTSRCWPTRAVCSSGGRYIRPFSISCSTLPNRSTAGPGVFNAAGQFPAPQATDLALSAEARHYYKSGRPYLQRHLPFWLAAFVERVLILLLPLLGVMVPLVRLAPSLYAWRIRRRILGLYTELRLLEQEVNARNAGTPPEELAGRLIAWTDGRMR